MHCKRSCTAVFILDFLVTLSCYATDYNVIDINDRVTCQHVNSSDLPLYQFQRLTEFRGQDIKLELKVCDKPINDSHCSNLDRSGWYFMSKCTLNKHSMDARCKLPNEVTDLEQGYFRVFIYTNVTLAGITDMFLYPLRSGCFCLDEKQYLPSQNDVKITYSEKLKRGVRLSVWYPRHFAASNSLNVYKYDFHLHRSVNNVSRVLPLKIDNPLEFDIGGLTQCHTYAFQISILPKFLNCRFKTGEYYRIRKFTYDPEHKCGHESEKKKSPFNTTLVLIISSSVIIVGLLVAFILVKSECAKQNKHRGKLYADSSSPSTDAANIIKSEHNYDTIDVYETIPADYNLSNMPATAS